MDRSAILAGVPTTRISQLREEVDRLNGEILDRIQRRAELVLEIGRLKRSQDLEKRDREREQAMLLQLVRKNAGPFDESEIRMIFQAIFDASLALMMRKQAELPERASEDRP